MAHGAVPCRSSPASRDCNASISFSWTLDIRNTSSTNKTPRVTLDRRRYGSAMQIPRTTHGMVDHGGSICGPEKNMEGTARVQTRSTNPNLTAVRTQWNSDLCYLGGTAGAGEYLEYHTEFWQQRSDPRFSCPHKREESNWFSVEWEAAAFSIWFIERSRSYVFFPAPFS